MPQGVQSPAVWGWALHTCIALTLSDIQSAATVLAAHWAQPTAHGIVVQEHSRAHLCFLCCFSLLTMTGCVRGCTAPLEISWDSCTCFPHTTYHTRPAAVISYEVNVGPSKNAVKTNVALRLKTKDIKIDLAPKPIQK
jgi:hypothetical protein